MPNKVSYIIQFKDRFSGVGNKLDRQFKQIDKSATKATRKMNLFAKSGERIKKMGRGMAGAGAAMTAAITVPAVLISKAMINAASDAEETRNKFNSVFKAVGPEASKASADFAKNFGVAGSTANKLIGDTGDLLTGFNFTGDAALKLSVKANKLAADLTSFQNVEGGVASASAAITKGMLGETESLKSLGIVVRQNTKEFRDRVKAIARSKGITEQQAKAIEILRQITVQSKNAIGDTKKTWDDYASVARRSAEQTKILREEFGKHLIPIATTLTKNFIRLAKWTSNLAPHNKKLIIFFTALVAIGAPLMAMLGGMALIFSALSLPVALFVGAIALIPIALGAMIYYWDDISSYLEKSFPKVFGLLTDVLGMFGDAWNEMWSGNIVNSVKIAMNAVGKIVNAGLSKISGLTKFIGLGEIKIPEFKTTKPAELKSAPIGTTPVNQASGTVDGNISVTAEKGTKINSTSMKNTGAGLNLGMNVANG